MARRKKLTDETTVKAEEKATIEQPLGEPTQPTEEIPAPKAKKKSETKAVVFEASAKPESKDNSLAGIYKVSGTAALNMRKGPDRSYGIMIELKNGDKVVNSGEYTETDGTKWLFVAYTEGNAVFEGYCMNNYLKK